MDLLKKAGIIAGAVAGGVVGGSISLVGKLSKKEVIDDIGASITSSSILTGEMAGKLASGAVDAASGKLAKDPVKVLTGVNDLKGCGKQVVGNFTENIRYLTGSGKEIAGGVVRRDREKTIESVKNLAKWLAVGAITVGAIKMTSAKEESKS